MEAGARTPYVPYGSGVYRREVRVEMPGPGLAVGEVVDDFHHFRASLRFADARVAEVEGRALRHPWTTCAGADVPLRRLVGMPLAGAGSVRAAGRYTEWRAQCTHLFDAAAIAIARTARGAGPVSYLIAAPDAQQGRGRIELERDGRALLAWELDGLRISGPAPFTGQRLRGGAFADWAEAELDAELAEAVLILHRAATIAVARSIDLEAIERADRVQPRNPMGQCHTYTPGTVEHAWRVRASVRNLARVDDLVAARLRP